MTNKGGKKKGKAKEGGDLRLQGRLVATAMS